MELSTKNVSIETILKVFRGLKTKVKFSVEMNGSESQVVSEALQVIEWIALPLIDGMHRQAQDRPNGSRILQFIDHQYRSSFPLRKPSATFRNKLSADRSL